MEPSLRDRDQRRRGITDIIWARTAIGGICHADFASTSPARGSSTLCRPAELSGQLPGVNLFLPIRVAQETPGLYVGSGLRDGVVSESKALLQQVRGYGKPVLLRHSLLDRARIVAIDRVVENLIEKR
jgi:hypothetical protein